MKSVILSTLSIAVLVLAGIAVFTGSLGVSHVLTLVIVVLAVGALFDANSGDSPSL